MLAVFALPLAALALPDPDPGLVLPGAGQVEAGWTAASVRAGGGYLYFYGGGPGLGAAVSLGTSPLPGWVIGASVVTNTIGQVYDLSVIGAASLGTRVLVAEGRAGRFGLAAAGIVWPGGACCIGNWYSGIGVVAAGGGRVGWDVSLPLVALGGELGGPYVPPGFGSMLAVDLLVSEIGATFRLGDRQRVRVGKYPGAVGATWTLDSGASRLDVTVASSGILTYAVVQAAFGLGPSSRPMPPAAGADR